MEALLTIMALLAIPVLTLWAAISFYDWFVDSFRRISLTENWNLFGFIWKGLKFVTSLTMVLIEPLMRSLKPRTPLQKEIESEQKEIEILERQKADMKELERLKARREKLFQELNNKEDSK